MLVNVQVLDAIEVTVTKHFAVMAGRMLGVGCSVLGVQNMMLVDVHVLDAYEVAVKKHLVATAVRCLGVGYRF